MQHQPRLRRAFSTFSDARRPATFGLVDETVGAKGRAQATGAAMSRSLAPAAGGTARVQAPRTRRSLAVPQSVARSAAFVPRACARLQPRQGHGPEPGRRAGGGSSTVKMAVGFSEAGRDHDLGWPLVRGGGGRMAALWNSPSRPGDARAPPSAATALSMPSAPGLHRGSRLSRMARRLRPRGPESTSRASG